MNTLLEQINQIIPLSEAATPGQWVVLTKGNTVQSHAIESLAGKVCAGISPKSNNAEFIAAARNLDFPALAAALSAVSPEGADTELAVLKQKTGERLNEFFEGKPGYRMVVDHYLRALEHKVKVLSGMTGYTYPAPIPFPAFVPKEELEQYYVTSEQRPTPHLLIWGDGENEAEWCGWDGDSYESSNETVTGFWPRPQEVAQPVFPAVSPVEIAAAEKQPWGNEPWAEWLERQREKSRYLEGQRDGALLAAKTWQNRFEQVRELLLSPMPTFDEAELSAAPQPKGAAANG